VKPFANVLMTVLGLLMIPVWILVAVAMFLTWTTCFFVDRFIFGEQQ
jgi:hypothetical protein